MSEGEGGEGEGGGGGGTPGGMAAFGGGDGGGGDGGGGGGGGTDDGGNPIQVPEFAAGWGDEGLKQMVVTKGYKDPESIAQAYQHAVAKLGKNPDSLIELPSDTNDMESMAPIFKALGRPDDPGGYDMNGVEIHEANVPIASRMAEVVHKEGLSQKQFHGIIGGFNEIQTDLQRLADQEKQQAFDASMATAKSQYGEKLPEMQKAGFEAMEKLGVDADVLDAIALSKAGPKGLLDFAYQVSQFVLEGSMDFGNEGGGPQNGGGFKGNPQQAASQLAALQKDPDFAAKYVANDAEAVALVDRLTTIMSQDPEASGNTIL